MNKEIHSVDKFEKECCDILNQDIDTIKNEKYKYLIHI